MTQSQKNLLVLLRLALGWIFFYSGITKVLNPAWSAEGFLHGAKTFAVFYEWFTRPEILPVTNALNAWGQLLIGAALLFGIFVRLGAFSGVLLMLLYYFPQLRFPYAGATGFLVDQHVIYTLALLLLAAFRVGRIWGLETWCTNLPICRRYPRLRAWIG